jgi:TetR/AcrR family transcriptional regulator
MIKMTNTAQNTTHPSEPAQKPPTKTPAPAKGERRVQILQMLAQMLENPAGEKITTAGLAKRLDVSEAALYRHFASKAQMFEGLIEFIETSVLGLLAQINQSDASAVQKIQKSLHVLLAFAQKNPGMARVLIGDVLLHENARLQIRVTQLIDRVQAALKQSFRDAAMETGWQPAVEVGVYSEFWMSWVVGRWHAYVRSGFKVAPTAHLEATWAAMGAL